MLHDVVLFMQSYIIADIFPGETVEFPGLPSNMDDLCFGAAKERAARAEEANKKAYLTQLKKRVESAWNYPDDVTGIQKVTGRFNLDRAGKLTQAVVLESSDSRLNASAVEAMKRASPFPPIPESLKDLANEPLIMRFEVSNRVRG
jgi:TonB family protein